MNKYTRKCPNCQKCIEYKHKDSFVFATKANSLCGSCAGHIRRPKGWGSGAKNPFFGKRHTKKTKDKLRQVDRSYTQTASFRAKISKVTSGANNAMYKKSIYDVWLLKYGQEKADELLKALKKKHSINSSGINNPMYGKPSPQGSGNGWSGWYKNHYFRSLRELTYIVGLDKNGKKWISAGSIKIKYVNWNGAARTYTPDFLVEEKYLVEIKPTRLRSSKIVQLKQEVAEEYCKENGLQYLIIDPIPLTDEEIKSLRENGDIKFIERYELLYQKKYGVK